MAASHSFVLRFPLPANIPPSFIIERIQEYEPLITPHPYLVRFERRPLAVAEVADDPFFRVDGRKLQSFLVTERIRLMPGVAKNITMPAVFQSFETGARVRADAQAGVRVWSTYGVEPREDRREGSWDLVERVELRCPRVFKAFVASSIEPAHKEICERMLDEFVRSYEAHQAPQRA